MKILMTAVVFLATLNVHAAYMCKGIAGTALESFELQEITKDKFEAVIDGRLDGVSEIGDILSYTVNNGCDNDITFRVHKMVTEYQPETFNMKVDYYGPDDLLTDTEVICRKINP